MSFLVSVSGRFSPITLNNYEIEKVTKVPPSEVTKGLGENVKNDTQQSGSKSRINNNIKKYTNVSNAPKHFNQQIISARASELMTKKVITTQSSSNLSEIKTIFTNHSFRHILIENEENFVCGIISEKDLIRNDSNAKAPAYDFMTNEVFFVLENTSLQDVARLMFEKKISCTPVANESYRLVGIITQSDILKFIFNQQFLSDLSI